MSNEITAKELLITFKEKFNKELEDVDFAEVCSDYDILDSIKEYSILSDMAEKDDVLKDKIEKIERTALRTKGLIKISREDNISYYLKKGEAYDREGNMIDCMFDEYLENEELFCDYQDDEIYALMKKNLLLKMKNTDNEEY